MLLPHVGPLLSVVVTGLHAFVGTLLNPVAGLL